MKAVLQRIREVPTCRETPSARAARSILVPREAAHVGFGELRAAWDAIAGHRENQRELEPS